MPDSILIIDDNTDIRQNIEELLALSGYTVFVASNGKEGVEKAKKNNPDLILCDILTQITQ